MRVPRGVCALALTAAATLCVVPVTTAAATTPASLASSTVDQPYSEAVRDAPDEPTRYRVTQGSGLSTAGALRAADVRRASPHYTQYVAGAYVFSPPGSLKDVESTVNLAIRTPGRVDYLVRFTAIGDEEQSVTLYGPSGEVVECDMGYFNIVYNDFRMRAVSAPSPCIGNPPWVRIGISTSAHAPGQPFAYVDDLRRDGRADPDGPPKIGETRLSMQSPTSR